MQTNDGGKHDILPVARPVRDHAVLPVTCCAADQMWNCAAGHGRARRSAWAHQDGRTRRRYPAKPTRCRIVGTVSAKNSGESRWHRRRRRAELGGQDNFTSHQINVPILALGREDKIALRKLGHCELKSAAGRGRDGCTKRERGRTGRLA